MTMLRFIPIFEEEEFIVACSEYEDIWKSESDSILEAIKDFTGLGLEESRIAVVVYEGVSFSGRGPNDIMKLRASYDKDVKKATLIHELSHRLLFRFKTESSEEEHKLLYLFLFDVWDHLYGIDYANRMVDIESGRTNIYKAAWDYALSMNQEKRQELLRDKLNLNSN